jgi:hypothetical protein
MNLLYQTMCAVAYRRIAMAIGMASKVGVFFYCRCFVCDHGGRRGNTQRILAQWQVSSGFYQSPEPPPLGDALGIVTVHLQSHQNGQQRRCICFHHLFWHQP